jgi:hypothetical protein
MEKYKNDLALKIAKDKPTPLTKFIFIFLWKDINLPPMWTPVDRKHLTRQPQQQPKKLNK